ncbi:MAG: HlyD family efflux transporter periplasmic adaptor subunit [Proteobacteria bacterium]|nr:HlyD family efflux transporter periplasmic adaptor subunit [Pseudomonadota bacterium]
MLVVLLVVAVVVLAAVLGWLSKTEGQVVVVGQDATIRPAASGQIVYIAPEGTPISKGDELLVLDDTLLKLKANEAKARLDEVRADVKLKALQAEEDLAFLRARRSELAGDFARAESRLTINAADLEYDAVIDEATQELYKSNAVDLEESAQAKRKRISSEAGVEEAMVVVEQRKEELHQIDTQIEKRILLTIQALEVTKARVAAREAEWKRYEEQRNGTRITSPIDGIVANTYASTGMYVRADDVALTVVDPTAVWIAVYVREELVNYKGLEIGQPVKVRLHATPGRTLRGKITENYAKLSTQHALSQSFEPYQTKETAKVLAAKVTLDAPDVEIKPGMTGEVLFVRRGPLQLAHSIFVAIKGMFG